MEARFLTPPEGQFESRYQRSNKSGGFKNLRCFPNCVSKDHRKGSPCTGPVIVGISGKLSDKRADIVAFARFRSDNPEEEEPIIKYELGSSYPRDDIEQYVRSKKNPLGAEFRGAVDLQHDKDKPKKVTATVEFSERGWHYGWTGGRYKTGQEHYFEVNFFEISPSNPKVLVHIGLVESTRFTLLSSRRANPEDKVKRRVKTKLGELADVPDGPDKDSKKQRHGKSKKKDKKRGGGAGGGNGKDGFLLPGNSSAVDELLDQLIELEDSNIPIGAYGEEDDFGFGGSEIGSDEDIDDIDLQLYLGEISSPASIMDEEKDSILISVGQRIVENEKATHTADDPLGERRDDATQEVLQTVRKASLSPNTSISTSSSTSDDSKSSSMNASPIAVKPVPAKVQQTQQRIQPKVVGSGFQHLQDQVPLHQQTTAPIPPPPTPKVSFLTKLFRALICS